MREGKRGGQGDKEERERRGTEGKRGKDEREKREEERGRLQPGFVLVRRWYLLYYQEIMTSHTNSHVRVFHPFNKRV
jgi:hypothetical protein